MSQFVLEPAGLEGVNQAGNTGCDRTLRSALITQRGVGNAQQVNSMVRAIQAQRASDCNAEIWNPYVIVAGTPPGATTALGALGFTVGKCTPALAVSAHMVGQTDVPATLRNVAVSRITAIATVYGGFARDAAGTSWSSLQRNRPTDGSQCWMYISQSNYWDQES